MSWQKRLTEINDKDTGLRVTEREGRGSWTVLSVNGYLDTANSHLFGKILMRGFKRILLASHWKSGTFSIFPPQALES
jgi:hypothetical protein